MFLTSSSNVAISRISSLAAWKKIEVVNLMSGERAETSNSKFLGEK
jgi:hypothetical protein